MNDNNIYFDYGYKRSRERNYRKKSLLCSVFMRNNIRRINNFRNKALLELIGVIMLGKRVQVYFNLHKKVFSVKDKKTGLVIAHVNNIYLEDVDFKVSQAGRKRVLAEKRKNVHAVVEGTVICPVETLGIGMEAVTYNPYKYDSFVIRQSEKPLKKANFTAMICLNQKPQTWAVM